MTCIATLSLESLRLDLLSQSRGRWIGVHHKEMNWSTSLGCLRSREFFLGQFLSYTHVRRLKKSSKNLNLT